MSTLLNGRYQMGDIIGKNNLTNVYMGIDTFNSTKVIVREYKASNTEVDTLEQFVNDAKVLMAHNNLPGLCKIFDVIEENNTAYVITEHVEGISIQEFIDTNGKTFPVARVKTLMEPVIDSLVTLHNEGFVHQNISTGNLIFANDGQLRLVCFGGKAVGYVPAEPRTPSTDVYSVSASIYKFITGLDPQDVNSRMGNDVMKAPSQLGVNITPQEEAVLMMGLNVNMNERFRTLVAFKKPFYMTPSQAAVPPTMPVQPIPEKIGEETTILTPEMEISQETPVPPMQPQAPVPPMQPQAPVPPMQQQAPVPPMQQQAPVPPMQAPGENPMAGIIVPPNSANVKEKKKGNGGFIVLIIIAVILIGILGATAFCIYTDNIPGFIAEMIGGSDSNIEDEEAEDEEGEEDQNEEDAISDSADEGAKDLSAASEIDIKCSEFETMLASDNFQAVIDGVLAMDMASLNDQEKGKIEAVMLKAIETQYNGFDSRVNDCMNSGDFEQAFKYIDEQTEYYEKLLASDEAKSYVDMSKVDSKKETVRTAHITYAEQGLINSALNEGDEEKLKAAIAIFEKYEQEGVLTKEDVYSKSTSAYARFVNGRVGAMSSSQVSAIDIYDFIIARLQLTGNNLQAIEFADYYEAVLGKNAKDVKVTHKDSDGYLLANSDSEILMEEDISHLSRYELRLALYEIFARHGRTFNDEAVNYYFSSLSWFTKADYFDQNDLNEYEKRNLDLIVEYQISKGYR